MIPLDRLVAEHGGDPWAALESVYASYIYLCSQASAGYMRAQPVKPGAAVKPRVEPLDVSSEQHPL